ncbi:MAG: tRNA lysidine(34) synthetase TilS [Nitrospirota bacterium]
MTTHAAIRRGTQGAIVDRVRDALTRLGPVARGETVVAGVSGGPDSLTLLHVLHRLSSEQGFVLHAAHYDHGLRGERSAAEARVVAAIGEQWGVPCTVETAATGDIDARGRGLQAAARLARYAFFDRVADVVGARWIATAHTADDQAETVLMRWVRGAGTTALAGIPAVRGRVIRPLLEISRAEVEAYVAECGVTPVRDPSNDDPKFLRARVRREVMPALRALNPRAVHAMARSAALLADDAAWLDAAARAACDRVRVESGPEWVDLDKRPLGDLPMAIRRRVIRFAVAGLGVAMDHFSAERIDAAAHGCAERTSGRLTLGLGLRIEFASNRVRLTREIERAPALPVVLAREGEYRLSAWGVVVRVRRTEAFLRNRPFGRWEAAFDSDRLPGMLSVRSRRPGDYVFPEGMRGRRRVQDLLVDERVPSWRRAAIPVLTAGDAVVWVVGFRRDRRYHPKPGGPAIEVEVASVGVPGQKEARP